ncbi:unnamed protein product [Mesocestoides corti]|uniref:Uncharacterized protein n=2 Tax=Mesocestoides corti TaxID=53468 RepID=A0A0R3UJH4_MESCO|nr:unnamed protein product [Mesocestoides corti]
MSVGSRNHHHSLSWWIKGSKPHRDLRIDLGCEMAGITFMALLRFRASGQGLLSANLTHPGMAGGEPPLTPQSAGIDDMYPPTPIGGGPMPPSQQPIRSGEGAGAYSQSYYPPPTF